MAPMQRQLSHAIDHCAIYTAPRQVSANVIGCIGSNSIGSICCTAFFTTQQLLLLQLQTSYGPLDFVRDYPSELVPEK